MTYITGGTQAGLGLSRMYKGPGAPIENTTGLGRLGVGDLYSDTTNGVLYIVVATNGTSTIAFEVVGAQE